MGWHMTAFLERRRPNAEHCLELGAKMTRELKAGGATDTVVMVAMQNARALADSFVLATTDAQRQEVQARFAAPVSARRPAPAAQRKRENMVSLLRQPPIRASSTLEGALIEVKEELGVSAPAAAAAVGV